MPQQLNQTIRVSFNKGLLTEFSELNFPQEASTDELNCDLFKAGNRTRRLGLVEQVGGSPSDETYTQQSLVHVCDWQSVGGNADLEYAVVQLGRFVRFYQKGIYPLSDGAVPTSNTDSTPFQIVLNNYNQPNGTGASTSKIDCTSINGHLVIVSPQIEPIYVSRDNETGEFTVTQINFKVRDFVFLGSPSFRTQEVSTAGVTTGRKYDHYNTGWVGELGEAALDAYIASESAYPPLTHPWYSGKDSSGNFDVAEWKKIYSGNSVTANGHFIIDLFNPNRDAVSGLSNVRFHDDEPAPTLTSRFSTVATYAGRVFFAGADSRVYFSPLLQNIRDIGNLYQINDPTSEEISDLLDTDGGYVEISDASGINKLHVFGASLIVFAKNGVWRISGVDDVFRATEYSVNKITDFGLAIKSSFVSGSNNIPLWWSYIGIHSIVVDENGFFREVNISKDTIQTFWKDIDSNAKGYVTSAFDGYRNRVAWFYPNNDETTEYKLNNILFFDVDLQAFYPWKISDTDETPFGNRMVGGFFYQGRGADESVYNVVDSEDNQVVDSAGNDVVVTLTAGNIRSSDIIVVCKDTNGAVFFSEFSGIDFLDWGTENYTSFAETSYNFVADLGRNKSSNYITLYARRTETGWRLNGSGTYDLVRPSSVLVSAYWDFKNLPATSAQQGYRLKYPLVVDTADLNTLDYPHSVITTRLKLRGRGKSVKIRFDSEEGKDFNLLGWETLDAINPGY